MKMERQEGKKGTHPHYVWQWSVKREKNEKYFPCKIRINGVK
jgi:hypothetical protein